ncbi:MAG: SGNH/GDSL hydrolase family protein [Clostridia bacterium]|nr:SGNH/GDSL hydrolase family protein [Clostridia bacterium]
MNIEEYINRAESGNPFDDMVTDGGMCAIFRSFTCVGDSLSSGEFESLDESGNRGYHDMYEHSWISHIGRHCGSEVHNFSCGGLSAETYINGYADYRGFWDKKYRSDAYIFALGVNDIINDHTPVGTIDDVDVADYRNNNHSTFAGQYSEIISRYKEIQPRAKMFLVTMPKDYKTKNDELKREHRDLLAKLCETFDNCYLIDLYTYAPRFDLEFKRKFFLGGHLNPAGYLLFSRMIETYIDSIVRRNPDDFRQVGFIGTDLYYKG